MGHYDIVGAEELVIGDDGYDDVEDVLAGYDIIGARHAMQRHAARGGHPAAMRGRGGHPAAAKQAALQHAASAAFARGAVAVTEQEPRRARRLVLPMSSTGTVAATAAATITARPQDIAFKPQRLVVPATVAPDFLILDIKCGNISQLSQAGTLPAEAFIPTLFDGAMEMDTVQTSQDFVVQVQNQAGVPRTFLAAVYGKAIRQ